jgi:hypothetical protein
MRLLWFVAALAGYAPALGDLPKASSGHVSCILYVKGYTEASFDIVALSGFKLGLARAIDDEYGSTEVQKDINVEEIAYDSGITSLSVTVFTGTTDVEAAAVRVMDSIEQSSEDFKTLVEQSIQHYNGVVPSNFDVIVGQLDEASVEAAYNLVSWEGEENDGENELEALARVGAEQSAEAAAEELHSRACDEGTSLCDSASTVCTAVQSSANRRLALQTLYPTMTPTVKPTLAPSPPPTDTPTHMPTLSVCDQMYSCDPSSTYAVCTKVLEEGDVRLSSHPKGLVEVYTNGAWATVW